MYLLSETCFHSSVGFSSWRLRSLFSSEISIFYFFVIIYIVFGIFSHQVFEHFAVFSLPLYFHIIYFLSFATILWRFPPLFFLIGDLVFSHACFVRRAMQLVFLISKNLVSFPSIEVYFLITDLLRFNLHTIKSIPCKFTTLYILIQFSTI